MRRISLFILVLLLIATTALATVFGTVRGIIHDPQHRPVSDTKVVLKARTSDYTQTVQSDVNGDFHFDAVPLGEYTVTVSQPSFVAQKKNITVLSGTAPILHFELLLATQNQSITVSAEDGPAQGESITPTGIVDREEISQTPGATRANSLAMITDYVPGAYLTHDQLHVRGGHQVSWLIDGVPIPNTNIASNLGPQIDPKDIDTVETQRGSYAADFGDRTYGVFNVEPRTGFERNNDGELVLGLGNFYQSDDQITFGGHTSRFAYYASASANRTNLGLETPTSDVIHDAANGYSGFGSWMYNIGSQDQLRLVSSARRDFYQVPFDSKNPDNAADELLRDANRENDAFAAFSWVHTFNPGLLLTVSPFFHFNRADFESNTGYFPTATPDDHSSKYEGGQATLAYVKGRNNARAGIYGFGQQDDQLFGVIFNDLSNPDFRERENVDGGLLALFAEEQFCAFSWLTLNAGMRQTHFSGGTGCFAGSTDISTRLRRWSRCPGRCCSL